MECSNNESVPESSLSEEREHQIAFVEHLVVLVTRLALVRCTLQLSAKDHSEQKPNDLMFALKYCMPKPSHSLLKSCKLITFSIGYLRCSCLSLSSLSLSFCRSASSFFRCSLRRRKISSCKIINYQNSHKSHTTGSWVTSTYYRHTGNIREHQNNNKSLQTWTMPSTGKVQ